VICNSFTYRKYPKNAQKYLKKGHKGALKNSGLYFWTFCIRPYLPTLTHQDVISIDIDFLIGNFFLNPHVNCSKLQVVRHLKFWLDPPHSLSQTPWLDPPSALRQLFFNFEKLKKKMFSHIVLKNI